MSENALASALLTPQSQQASLSNLHARLHIYFKEGVRASMPISPISVAASSGSLPQQPPGSRSPGAPSLQLLPLAPPPRAPSSRAAPASAPWAGRPPPEPVHPCKASHQSV